MKRGLHPEQKGGILLIKLRAIGDVLLSTVVLKNLRAAFPDSRIDFLTEKGAAEVLAGNGSLDHVLVFDGAKQSSVSLLRMIRRRRYDMVIDLFGNPRSAIIALTSGAPTRVGYRFGWRRYCYTLVVEPRGGAVHNTEFNLDALRALGVPVTDRSPVFPLRDEDRRFGAEFFRSKGLAGRFVIALNAGGGWYTKRWPVRKFSELGDLLSRKYSAGIVLLWGPGERGAAEQIASLMTSPVVLIPPASLKQLGAIMERCSVIVTNDSGPMHIASSLGTPVVAIFGPTNPGLQGPVGARSVIVQHAALACLGCNYVSCPIGNPCMEELAVDDVAAAVSQLCESTPHLRSSSS